MGQNIGVKKDKKSQYAYGQAREVDQGNSINLKSVSQFVKQDLRNASASKKKEEAEEQEEQASKKEEEEWASKKKEGEEEEAIFPINL